MADLCTDSGSNIVAEAVIHAAGWLFSCASACCIHFVMSQLSGSDPEFAEQHSRGLNYSWRYCQNQVIVGFYVTAVAALATDLLGSYPVTPLHSGSHRFCCGNFGLMLADMRSHCIDVVKVCCHTLTLMLSCNLHNLQRHVPVK